MAPRLVLNFARAEHSFPKYGAQRAVTHNRCALKTLLEKMLSSQLLLLLNLFLWVEYLMHNVPVQTSGYLKKGSEKLQRWQQLWFGCWVQFLCNCFSWKLSKVSINAICTHIGPLFLLFSLICWLSSLPKVLKNVKCNLPKWPKYFSFFLFLSYIICPWWNITKYFHITQDQGT